MASIRGLKGTTVRLTIIPAGVNNPQVRELSFVRGEINVPLGRRLTLGDRNESSGC